MRFGELEIKSQLSGMSALVCLEYSPLTCLQKLKHIFSIQYQIHTLEGRPHTNMT